jgi:hypothetical protein
MRRKRRKPYFLPSQGGSLKGWPNNSLLSDARLQIDHFLAGIIEKTDVDFIVSADRWRLGAKIYCDKEDAQQYSYGEWFVHTKICLFTTRLPPPTVGGALRWYLALTPTIDVNT